MGRREFLRRLGLGTGSAVAMMALEPFGALAKNSKTLEMPSDKNDGPIRMTYRVQHGSNIQVSLLGFGMMRLPNDQDEVNEMVDYAIAHGVNYFDTAPMYMGGQSEVLMGNALSRHPREKYYVATKMSNQNRSLWAFDKAKEMYLKSMERLKVDYIDYYLLHSIGGGGVENLKERFLDNKILDFLLEERKAGRIRHLGFSYHGDVSAFDWLLDHQEEYHWDFVQIQMNYLDWTHAGGRNTNADHMYEQLAARDIPVVIMEPLRGGGLASLTKSQTALLKEREPDRSVASWAFRFVGSFPKVLTALSGMTYREHLEDNLRTFCNFKPLVEEEFELLEQIAEEQSNFPLVGCTGCQYCMPCPYGINIPGVFRFYDNSVVEGTYVKGPEQEKYAKARRRYLAEYNKAVESVRQADHCISCGKCMKACPQHIRIPRELKRIDEYIEKIKQDLL